MFSRQAFNKYLKTKSDSLKYHPLADAMVAICREDECNDTCRKDPYVSGVTAQTAEGVDMFLVRELFIVSWKKLVLP